MEEQTVRHSLSCPECEFPMVLATNPNARYPKSGMPRKYYRCARYPRCKGHCGAHPDGTPLGIPGNVDTRHARYDLHQVFDALWMLKRWSRQEAYGILQILMEMDEEQAHIGNFSEEQCDRAMGLIRKFLKMNPEPEPTKGIPSQYRFVLVDKVCEHHGETVHRVYLEGRETFCAECLSQHVRPIWRQYLLFKAGRPL